MGILRCSPALPSRSGAARATVDSAADRRRPSVEQCFHLFSAEIIGSLENADDRVDRIPQDAGNADCKRVSLRPWRIRQISDRRRQALIIDRHRKGEFRHHDPQGRSPAAARQNGRLVLMCKRQARQFPGRRGRRFSRRRQQQRKNRADGDRGNIPLPCPSIQEFRAPPGRRFIAAQSAGPTCFETE